MLSDCPLLVRLKFGSRAMTSMTLANISLDLARYWVRFLSKAKTATMLFTSKTDKICTFAVHASL